MSFNFLIDSNNNINQINQNPINSLVVDPSLNYLYIFNPNNLSGNLLQNQGISQAYDLIIDEGLTLTNEGILIFPTTDTVGPQIVGDMTLSSYFSVGCWLKLVNNGNGFIFYSAPNNTGNTNRIGLSVGGAGVLTILIFSGDTPYSRSFQSVTPYIDTWFHVCFVINGADWLVYVNGVPQTSTTAVVVNNTPIVRGYSWVGRRNTSGNINGSMANFFIYDGVLTTEQIVDIYNKGVIPTQTNYYYTIPIQPKLYAYANNSLNYYFDFSRRPLHPYGGNRYKVYSSFISFATTPSSITRTNQMSYYIVDGLGTFNTFVGRGGNPPTTMRDNHLVKNITLKRSTNFVGNQYNQRWIDLDPMMPLIIQNLNETGIINVEIRLLNNNRLSNNVNTWGAVATSYAIQLLFEPIP
jgi:hypothetical protein